MRPPQAGEHRGLDQGTWPMLGARAAGGNE